TMTQLPRFERKLARWFGRQQVPIWITEYDYRTEPGGVTWAQQANYLRQALGMAAADPSVGMFIWYVLRDDPRGPWPGGLMTGSGKRKPAFAVFTQAAHALDARDPILDVVANVRPWVHVSARDVAYYDGVGAPVGLSYVIEDGSIVVRQGHVAT